MSREADGASHAFGLSAGQKFPQRNINSTLSEHDFMGCFILGNCLSWKFTRHLSFDIYDILTYTRCTELTDQKLWLLASMATFLTSQMGLFHNKNLFCFSIREWQFFTVSFTFWGYKGIIYPFSFPLQVLSLIYPSLLSFKFMASFSIN